jgi:multidrug efflux pump subunit AcrA (membrane-fusion protein)
MSRFDSILANIRKKQSLSAKKKKQLIFWQNIFMGFSPLILLSIMYSNRFALKEFLDINWQDASPELLPQQQINEIISVPAIKAEKVDSYFIVREYSGIIEARKTSFLGFPQSGQVQAVYVEVGQQVKKGQIIARLNNDLLFQEKERLIFELDKQQYILSDLLLKPDIDEVDQIDAQIQDKEQQISLLLLTEKRYQYLYNEGAISLERLDISQSSLKSAYSQLEILKSQKAQLEQGTPAEIIDSQRALINTINAQISSIDIQIKQNILTAPYDGIISTINLKEGSFYNILNSIPLAEIRTNQVEFRIGVTPDIIPYLKATPNQKIIVDSKVIDVTLSRISPESDLNTKTVSVIFEPQSNELNTQLIINQLAVLQTTKEVDQTGYKVPLTALDADIHGNWQVLILTLLPEYSDVYEVKQLPVTVISTRENYVVVTGSIAADTLIIADGLNKVVPHQIVKIAQDDTEIY